MNLNSKKFKYLLQAQKQLGDKIVPAFIKIESESDVQKYFSTSIMRSSLKGEADEQNLLSGKSLSIPQLKDIESLKSAYQQINKQATLEEIILQEEIEWDQHLTLIHERGFLFIESKTKDPGSPPQFSYWTPVGHTSNGHELFTSINKILRPLSPMTDTDPLWLLEIGVKAGNFYLFQIQPIAFSFLDNLFSQNLVQEMLLSRQRFQKSHGLWAMIKTEWAAYKFRRNFSKTKTPAPSWIFLNWEFIFHYFRIFCLQKKLKPNQDSFSAFLTIGHEKNWLGEILRRHFMMANQLRLHESHSEVSFVFNQNTAFIFIGRGTFRGRLGTDIALLPELTPQQVYELSPNTIILTKTISLLSHGILAAIEMKMRVVAGIPDEEWEKLSGAENIFLDFEARTFELK